jgi:hypothetical protein
VTVSALVVVLAPAGGASPDRGELVETPRARTPISIEDMSDNSRMHGISRIE